MKSLHGLTLPDNPFTSQTIPVHKKPASLTRICSLWSSNCQSTYSIRTLYGSFEKEISMPSWSSSYHQQQTTAYCSISMDDYCNHSTQYCWSGGDTCRLFCIWSYSSLGTGGSWCAGWGRLDSGRGLWSRWRSKKEEAYRRVIGIQKLIIQLYWSWLPMDQIQMNDNKWLTMVSVRNDLKVTVDDVVQIKGHPNHPASQGRTDQLTLGDECHHCQED